MSLDEFSIGERVYYHRPPKAEDFYGVGRVVEKYGRWKCKVQWLNPDERLKPVLREADGNYYGYYYRMELIKEGEFYPSDN